MSFGSLPSVLGNGGGVAISVIGGTGLFADGTAAAPSISFAADSDTGLYRSAANEISIACAGGRSFSFGTAGQFYAANGAANITGSALGSWAINAAGTNQNITLSPSGSGIFNVTSQSRFNDVVQFNSAGTAGNITWGSGTFQIVAGSAFPILTFSTNNGTEAMRILANQRVLLGTTTDSGALLQIGTNTVAQTGGMVFGTDTFLYRDAVGTLALNGTGTNSYFSFLENGTAKGFVGTAGGDLYLATSTAKSVLIRTNSILALTLDSSQNATFAGSVTAGTSANFTFSGRSYISSPADGIIRLLNNAGSDFSRLQFGGTTSAFPALKRSGPSFHARLADDTAYTDMAVSVLYAFGAQIYFDATGTVVLRAGANSPEGAITAPVGSLYSRTNGGAGTTLYVKESGTGNTGWVAK